LSIQAARAAELPSLWVTWRSAGPMFAGIGMHWTRTDSMEITNFGMHWTRTDSMEITN
jgi:hypothetical protein